MLSVSASRILARETTKSTRWKVSTAVLSMSLRGSANQKKTVIRPPQEQPLAYYNLRYSSRRGPTSAGPFLLPAILGPCLRNPESINGKGWHTSMRVQSHPTRKSCGIDEKEARSHQSVGESFWRPRALLHVAKSQHPHFIHFLVEVSISTHWYRLARSMVWLGYFRRGCETFWSILSKSTSEQSRMWSSLACFLTVLPSQPQAELSILAT